MPVSPFFNHISAENEQDLFHDLAAEFVYLSGISVYYIKSDAITDENFDQIFGENRFQTLGEAKEIEMYLENMETPYGGMGDMFSKFGLTQNQTVTFIVAYRRFEEEFGMRPREGDYIYIPKWHNRGPDIIFRISYVEFDKDQFVPTGDPKFYQIKADRARLSHENIETKLDIVDLGAEERLENVVNDDTDIIEELGDIFINFDEQHPFGRP
jgi:hypothetical protein